MVTDKLRLKRKLPQNEDNQKVSQEETSSAVRITRSKSSNSKNDCEDQNKTSSPVKEASFTTSSPKKKKIRSSPRTESESTKSLSQKIDRPSSSTKLKKERKKPLATKLKKSALLLESKQHFRSSFKPLISFLHNHFNEIPKEFDEEMFNSPFGPLYKVFRSNIVKENDVKKTNAAIIKIAQQFSKKEKMFKFGKKWVQLTMEDVAVVFGVPGAGKTVNLVDRSFQEKTDFVNRLWPDFGKDRHISKTDVQNALQRVLKGKKDTDKIDYVRLMVTYMVMTIFSPSSAGRISWSFFPYVEMIENLHKIDWASTIHKTLFDQLCNWDSSKPWTITGCSLTLLYFVCEHTNLIPQIKGNEDYFPRFAKWSTTDLVKVLEKQQLDKLQDDMVFDLLRNFKEEEANLLINKNEDEFVDDIFEDIRETELTKLRTKIQSLESENADLRNEVKSLREMLEKNNEGKNQTNEDISEIEKEVRIWEFICDETISQFNNSLAIPFAATKGWTSQRIEKENLQEGQIHSEISPRNEGIQLEIQVSTRNEETHFQTGISPRKEDEEVEKKGKKLKMKTDPKSTVSSGVKTRKQRMAKLQPEIDGNKDKMKGKKRKADAFVEESETIEVDKFMTIQEDVKLKDVTKSEVWNSLNNEEKAVVENFFRNANRNTEVWKSEKTDVVIYGATLEALMFNEPISSLVINWYSYQLSLEQIAAKTKSYYFPAETFQILYDGNEQLIENSVVNIINSIDSAIDYWFIPINTCSPDSIKGHHWTLLHVDTSSWEWMHYNTLSPRQTKGRRANNDKCFKNAKMMRDSLITLMKRCWDPERFLKVNLNTKVVNADCTQQTENPNCALYVCYFMDMLSNDRQVTAEDEEELGKKMDNLRAQLVYLMLTNEDTCHKYLINA